MCLLQYGSASEVGPLSPMSVLTVPRADVQSSRDGAVGVPCSVDVMFRRSQLSGGCAVPRPTGLSSWLLVDQAA